MTDDKAFTALMRQYQSYVYTICYRFVLDAAQAEDLTQETFLAAYLHRERCVPGCEKPWLARIAVNKAKDLLRSGWNRRVQLSVADPENTAEDPMLQVTGPPEEQPEEQSLRAERVGTVRREVCALPPPYHDVAVLVFLQEKTPDEAARITNRPPKTVYTQLARAKKLLAERLKEVADCDTV